MKNNDPINRRRFLKRAGAAGMGLGMASYLGSLAKADSHTAPTSARKIEANDRITAGDWYKWPWPGAY